MANTNNVNRLHQQAAKTTLANVELPCDVIIATADDVTFNHGQCNDDEQNQRDARQQPKQRSAGDFTSGQQGLSLASRHSTKTATRNEEVSSSSSRSRQPINGSRDKRIIGGGAGVGMVFSSRTDDVGGERKFDGDDVTTKTERQRFNIPITSVGDKYTK